MPSSLRRPARNSLSPVLVIGSAALVALGAVTSSIAHSTSASGAAQPRPVHDPAQNAWPFHLVLTALAAIALSAAFAWMLRGRRGSAVGCHEQSFLERAVSALTAPWRRGTADRIVATIRLARVGSVGAWFFGVARVLRAALVTFAVFAVAYALFRFGMQLGYIGRPAEYVNAWGGPSYVGAMYAHVLDMLVLIIPLGLLARAAAAPVLVAPAAPGHSFPAGELF